MPAPFRVRPELPENIKSRRGIRVNEAAAMLGISRASFVRQYKYLTTLVSPRCRIIRADKLLAILNGEIT